MTSKNFTLSTQRHGIRLAGVSITAAQFLQEMESTPAPLTANNHKGSKLPGPSQSLGPLIRHGLARLERDRSVYVITDKGMAYLRKLESLSLLPKTACNSAS